MFYRRFCNKGIKKPKLYLLTSYIFYQYDIIKNVKLLSEIKNPSTQE